MLCLRLLISDGCREVESIRTRLNFLVHWLHLIRSVPRFTLNFTPHSGQLTKSTKSLIVADSLANSMRW